VLDGVLEHDFDHALLETVIAKYAKIDQVPNNYLQPELFEEKMQEAPVNLTRIEFRDNDQL